MDEGRYYAALGSVVWEDAEHHRHLMVGTGCPSDPENPVVNKIGVDSTDPGMKNMLNPDHWERAVFPGRPDLLFATKDDEVVWVEAKTNWADFDSSRRSKRLAREVKGALDMADIVVVAYPTHLVEDNENRLELLRLQCLGVHVVPWSTVWAYWDDIRNVLGSARNQRRALAGSDKRKPRTVLAGFPGVGPKTEAKLLASYGTAEQAVKVYPYWDAVLGERAADRIRSVLKEQKSKG